MAELVIEHTETVASVTVEAVEPVELYPHITWHLVRTTYSKKAWASLDAEKRHTILSQDLQTVEQYGQLQQAFRDKTLPLTKNKRRERAAKRKASEAGGGDADGDEESPKKRRREVATGGANAASILGADARPELQLKLAEFLKPGERLRTHDLQNLVLWVLADGEFPKWIFVKNKTLISKVVVVVVSALGEDVWVEHRGDMPTLAAIAGDLTCPSKAPGNGTFIHSFIGTFLQCPLPKSQKRKQKAQRAAASAHPPAHHYVLSPEELRAGNYPLPVDYHIPPTNDPLPYGAELVDSTGFVTTQARAEGTMVPPGRHIVAIDCEMVETSAGLELARLTVLDADGALLSDLLVAPERPVVDYLTRYSGITEDMLRGVTARLADAQRAMLEYVRADTILVGHSLENDLKALQIIHLNIADTAVIFAESRNRPALRNLAYRLLDKRVIQSGSDGHDSAEDARAALDLFNMKVKHGPSFGSSHEGTESLFERLERSGRSCAIVDTANVVSANTAGAVDAYPCCSDEETAARTARVVAGKTNFLWAQLHDLERYYYRRKLGQQRAAAPTTTTTTATPPVSRSEALNRSIDDLVAGMKADADGDARNGENAAATAAVAAEDPGDGAEEDGPAEAAEDAITAGEVAAVLARADEHLRTIWEALPSGALLMVATGQGDATRMRELIAQKKSGDPWSQADEATLAAAAAATRASVSFFAVKP